LEVVEAIFELQFSQIKYKYDDILKYEFELNNNRGHFTNLKVRNL